MGFQNPPWITLKHHLFNAKIPNKLLKAIREIATGDKKDSFAKGRLFQTVCKILISKTPDELSGVDFSDYGDPATTPYARYFSRYSLIFIFGDKKAAQADDKVVNAY